MNHLKPDSEFRKGQPFLNPRMSAYQHISF